MRKQPSSEAKEEHPVERLSFRGYQPADSQRFFEIMASSWPKLTRSIHACSVDWYEASAIWREVACSSDTVIGILFGKTDRDLTSLRNLMMRLAHAAVYMKLFFGLYGRLPHRLTVIKEAISSDRQIAATTANTDGEVTFFAVDAGHRGKGIGKALMDRFIEHARKTGARRISVYTIDPGSELSFYENYGFKRNGSFRDGFMSFASGEEVTAIIYMLEL